MNRNLLFLLFFVINLSVFSQNYRVIYAIVPNNTDYKNLQDPAVKQRVEARLQKK